MLKGCVTNSELQMKATVYETGATFKIRYEWECVEGTRRLQFTSACPNVISKIKKGNKIAKYLL